MALKESLVCEVCSSTWTRNRSRGRKPRVCPECVKDNVVLHECSSVVPAQSSKKATKWICPLCDNSVVVFVNLEYPPVCQNPVSHSSRKIEMQISGRQAQVAV